MPQFPAQALGARSLGPSLGMDEMPAGFPPMGRPAAPVNLSAGYSNEYGAAVGVSADPLRQGISANVRLPLGDHQSGWNLEATGGWDREAGGNAMLRVGKRNVPRVDESAVDEIVQRHLDRARSAGLSVNDVLDSEIRDRVRRDQVDALMGVGAPGREKYGFHLGVNSPFTPGGAGMQGLPEMEGLDMRRGAEPGVMPVVYR